MKKVFLLITLFFAISISYADYPQCKQVYVCGGGGCQWVVVCK